MAIKDKYAAQHPLAPDSPSLRFGERVKLNVMSHEMEIRLATAQDIDHLGEMNKRLIEDEGHSNPMSVSELTERMRSWLSAEYRAYIVWDDFESVAYGLYREEEQAYYLRQLFVDRGHRRRGIATLLLDWLFSKC